jgi:hypothetical protein
LNPPRGPGELDLRLAPPDRGGNCSAIDGGAEQQLIFFSGISNVTFSRRSFILACISGVLSYFSVSLPHRLSTWFVLSDDAFFILPGLFFGIFVLAPRVRRANHRTLRCAGLLIFSVVAWYVAVTVGFQVLPLVEQLAMLSCGISGSIGVLLLIAASRYLVPLNLGFSSSLIALVVGFIGGGIIGMALVQPRSSLASELLYFIGFLFWHSGVAAALFDRPRAAATNGPGHTTA